MGDLLAGPIIDAVLNWFASTVQGILTGLWGMLSSTIFQTPDVTQAPQVRTFAATSLGVVNTCYVLAILTTAIMIMGRGTIQHRVGPSELVPRLIIGLLAANFALPLCSTIIDVANALTMALTRQDISSAGSLQLLRATVDGAVVDPAVQTPQGFLLILIALLIAVLVAMLLVQWIIRLGLLIVVVGISPIALALHGTPQTEGAAKLWWRTFLGALGTVVIQAVGLHLTLSIFLSPQANLPALGVPANPGATFNLFVVVCLLLGVIKVPGLVRRYVTRTHAGTTGQIVRLVAIQTFTRGFGRLFSAGRAGARTTVVVNNRGGWPVDRGGRGGRPPSPNPRPTTPATPRPGGGGRGGRPQPANPTTPSTRPGGAVGGPRPMPSPSGAGPGRVATAYPSGRPVRPYTREELAHGVDVYTRALKNRTLRNPGRTQP